MPRDTTESSGPDLSIRYLVRDWDMMLLLKKIYGWEGQNSLRDIMDNEEILQKFFETVEEGRAFLRLFKRRREYTKQQQNANAKHSWHQHFALCRQLFVISIQPK